MKRKFVVVFVLFLNLNLFAISVTPGIKAGTNMNSNVNAHYAFNTGVFCDVQLAKYFNLGAECDFSCDFANNYVISPYVFGLFNIGEHKIGKNNTFLPYIKIDLGASILGVQSAWSASFMAGIEIGCRFIINNFTFGPYVEIGYPFTWGCGAFFAYRIVINAKQNAEEVIVDGIE